MEAIGLVIEEDKLKEDCPADGEINKSGHFVNIDESFRVVLFVVEDEEICMLGVFMGMS